MANAKEVRLYGMTRSGYCLMVHHALRLKGVPYDYVEEDLKNKSQELLRLNPVHKKVPVLVVDGRPVAESLVILQYIDELWGSLAPRLLPEDPHRRAKVRFWADFVYQKVRNRCKSVVQEIELWMIRSTLNLSRRFEHRLCR